MTYLIFASVFFSTVLVGILLVFSELFRLRIWLNLRRQILKAFGIWLMIYLFSIWAFTGPTDLSLYPSQNHAKYHLPWKAGVSRFVAQGNRSFTSHRDFHEYAWDFVMPNGTEILAARNGRVFEIEDTFDGIGYHSNFIIVEHEDGERSAYAHIKYQSSLVKVGDIVRQGQPIALSGMVGQTIFPHVHFYVINKEGTSSIPVSFHDVPGGVPFAGHFYTSENTQKTESQ